MDIEKIRKRHERDADQGPDKTTYGTTAYLYAWEQAHLDRGELLRKVDLQAGAREFDKENSAGLAAELEDAEKRIAELEAELRYAVEIMVAEQDSLNPDQVNYLMSAKAHCGGKVVNDDSR
jgi:hypothetical protein